jgi:hypothetical protein
MASRTKAATDRGRRITLRGTGAVSSVAELHRPVLTGLSAATKCATTKPLRSGRALTPFIRFSPIATLGFHVNARRRAGQASLSRASGAPQTRTTDSGYRVGPSRPGSQGWLGAGRATDEPRGGCRRRGDSMGRPVRRHRIVRTRHGADVVDRSASRAATLIPRERRMLRPPPEQPWCPHTSQSGDPKAGAGHATAAAGCVLVPGRAAEVVVPLPPGRPSAAFLALWTGAFEVLRE